MINQLLNNLFTERKVIYVLQGFTGQIERDQISLKNLVAILDGDYLSFENIDTQELLVNLTQKLVVGNSYYIYYEELLYLQKLGIIGNIELMGYKLEIIEHNLYFRYYPSFERSRNTEKVVEKTISNHESVFQHIFSFAGHSNDKLIVSYNEHDKNIPIKKLIDENNLESIIIDPNDSFKESVDIYKDMDIKSRTSIIAKAISDSGSISFYFDDIENSADLANLVSKLNFLNVSLMIYKKRLSEPKKHPSDYEKILKRINSDYKFREIAVYKDPLLSKEIIHISQEEIIDDIVTNAVAASDNKSFRDIYVTAPTGSGKSVMFQIPAIYLAEKFKKLTIVVSPLIGLMNDQVDNIEKLTDEAATINSEYTPYEKETILKQVREGEKSILYISPETLLSNTDITNLIGEREIGLLVIDEAHTVATWGKSFRPDYWYLGEFIYRLRSSRGGHSFPIATFTATATYGGSDDMYQEIIDGLFMTIKAPYLGRVIRDDISFNIFLNEKTMDYKKEKLVQAGRFLSDLILKGEKTIVYCPYTKHISEVQNEIKPKLRKFTGKYYGSLEKADKHDTMEKIKTGEIKTVIATKAFGMGIDVDDINNIYHFAPTGNLADYVQEIGRAARREDIQGTAITHFYKEDFRYINQLHGMSKINDFEVIGVLRKIHQLYKKNKSRNFLASPEEFAHVFNVKTDDEIDNRMKTTLLIIKKDFDLDRRINFVPLIFKPRSMFTKGLFIIPDGDVAYFEKKGWMKYLKVYRSKDFMRKQEYKIKTTYIGDVYSLDFKNLWEDKFKEMSFGQFKRAFFLNELENIDLDHKLLPQILLDLQTSVASFGNMLELFKKYIHFIKSTLSDIKMSNKQFKMSYFSDKLWDKFKDTGIRRSSVKMLAENIMGMVDNVNSNSFVNGSFYNYNQKENLFFIKNNGFMNKLDKIYSQLAQKLNIYQDVSERSIVIGSPKYNNRKMKNTILLIAAQLIEIFELGGYEIKSGDKPEFFIRVNSESEILKVIDNPNYFSKTLASVNHRHKLSRDKMEYFFTQLESDRDRWEFIEDYFLGRND
jgi:ATP-dependent DNA helicase RecQ